MLEVVKEIMTDSDTVILELSLINNPDGTLKQVLIEKPTKIVFKMTGKQIAKLKENMNSPEFMTELKRWLGK